ncbi:MAG: ABC transporter ATP-binding protein, partial [Eubacteriales bacterium]
MSKLFQCFRTREWIVLVVMISLICVQVWLDLRLPDYMSEITALVQTEGVELSEVLAAGGKMMGCAFGGLFVTVVVGFFSAQTATKVAQRLREQVYHKTISFSMGDINHFSTGSLITRTTNDVTQVQLFVAMGFVAMVRAPLTAIFAIWKISGKNLVFTQITLVAVAVLVVVLFTMICLAVPKSKQMQALTDQLNTKVREHLIGIRVVRAYNAEKYQEAKFKSSNDAFSGATTFVNRTTAVMTPFLMGLMSSLTMVIYWAGAFLINEAFGMEKLDIFSEMVVFTSYAMQIIMSFMLLTMIFMILPRVLVALGRIGEVIDFENSIVDGKGATSQSDAPVISFQNVSFGYSKSGENAIKGMSFDVNRGETVAIIGATGSGKTTLVNLMLRFYDTTEGVILVDGVP